MSTNSNDDNNPWRHHPLFAAYNKFYEGKNIAKGRLVAFLIAIIIILVIVLWFYL
jgi:hypothetical protein